jgi:hypothetical protein
MWAELSGALGLPPAPVTAHEARFSTLEAMASSVRAQVNEEILAGIRDRMTAEERRQLRGLPDVIGLDRKTLFNALKQNPGRATWSNFRRLKGHLE